MNSSCDWDIPGSLLSSLDLSCQGGSLSGLGGDDGGLGEQPQGGLPETHPLIAYTVQEDSGLTPVCD